jgi:hypothetical protein
VAWSLACSSTFGKLDRKRTTFNRVNKNVTRWEQEVRPSANKLDDTAHCVILRVNIKETFYGDFATSGVFADRTDIVHPYTSAIVALVSETVNNVQVMVDSFVVGCIVISRPLWVSKICKVNDVRDRTASSTGSVAFLL